MSKYIDAILERLKWLADFKTTYVQLPPEEISLVLNEIERLRLALDRAHYRMNEAAELLEQSQAKVVDAGRCGAVVVLRSALAGETIPQPTQGEEKQ